jgi:hypothetical protein
MYIGSITDKNGVVQQTNINGMVWCKSDSAEKIRQVGNGILSLLNGKTRSVGISANSSIGPDVVPYTAENDRQGRKVVAAVAENLKKSENQATRKIGESLKKHNDFVISNDSDICEELAGGNMWSVLFCQSFRYKADRYIIEVLEHIRKNIELGLV